ncbi:xanthine dehydrogenase accessory protein XdhC [Methylophaga sp.]|uniref:xanthine dehydrogenase accessory protein XdhC n=1 Tax=Methylophaga sp. TaxID=2024840 RepID=UPI002719D09A|nr:xanthine dehydrogenase accessory protein XdhC [Methylophaga sp.]MDO8826851.1 xanthine dehydrogenase accessory protein XdhC [Methylophaga sp.]
MSKLTWAQAVRNNQQHNVAYALLTVLGIEGSSPRDHDAKMVVSETEIWDTIGGGRLEHDMIDYARELLKIKDRHNELKQFILGPETGQCCGGKITILFEIFPNEPFTLAVFGAGHIAQRLMPLLDELPGKKIWVDQRAEWLEKLPLNDTEKVLTNNPVEVAESLPMGFSGLVFTHEHTLDFQLIETMLKRDDASYVGLIASKSKVARFKSILRDEGLTELQISKLTAPVGLSEIPGKLPVEVAVSIAGQLIQLRHHLIGNRSNSTNSTKRGLNMNQIKSGL